jgi:hypothetical protein
MKPITQIEVALPGNPPRTLKVIGTDYDARADVLRVAVAFSDAADCDSEHLSLGCASLSHLPDNGDDKPLACIGQFMGGKEVRA